MRRTTITVLWDDEHRPEGVDAEEWAYTLRMGGIDVESVMIDAEEQGRGRYVHFAMHPDGRWEVKFDPAVPTEDESHHVRARPSAGGDAQ